MKKILATSCALLAWTSLAWAGGAKTMMMPVEDYQAILDKLNSLQKRVDMLEGQQKAPVAAPAGDFAEKSEVAQIKKDVNHIYDTLDSVETKTLMDRINLGAEVRTRVDNFRVDNHMFMALGGPLNPNSIIDDTNDNAWSNRFRINMDAEILKNLKFTGRLAVLKNFADGDSSAMLNDANRAHVPDDTTVKLDRAYIDWVPKGLPVPVAITFGRHPSSEGPPFEYKENRLRQSTYPALLFDGEADGIVATIGLERYTGWSNSGLRLAYGKGYQDDDDFDNYLDDKIVGLHDTNVYAAFLETEISQVKDSLLVLSYVRGEDFTADTTDFGGNSANIGDMDIFGIHAQVNKLAGSNVDVFLSTGLNKSHPSGTVQFGPGTVGLLNNDGNESNTGWAVYTGLRYTIPSVRMNNPMLGFEYNHGSEHWFSFTLGSTELFNKLATRGDVFDVYYIQPFNKNLFMRAGYTFANYDYALSGWHIGDSIDSDEELRNFYFLLDCRF